MVRTARRDHPDLLFTEGALRDLPYADAAFSGVLLWCSIIHTAPGGLAGTVAEVSRFVRPAGCVLVGFHSGDGLRDVTWAHEQGIRLDRYLHAADHVAAASHAAGLQEVSRLVRRARDQEPDDQSFLLLQKATSPDLTPMRPPVASSSRATGLVRPGRGGRPDDEDAHGDRGPGLPGPAEALHRPGPA